MVGISESFHEHLNRQNADIQYVSYGQQVEEISKSSKYCHCNILERQKVLNHGIKLENNKATPS